MTVVSPRLLSEHASRSDSRPLTRWSDDELQAFADAVVQALLTVARAWSPGGGFETSLHEASTDIALHAVHAEDLAGMQARTWTPTQPDAAAGPWWSCDGAPLVLLRSSMFGEAAVGPSVLDDTRIADELAASVWSEQCAALTALAANARPDLAPDSGSGVPPPSLWRRWSGAVVVTTPWRGVALHWLFTPDAVDAVLNVRGRRRPASSRVAGMPAVAPLKALAAVPARIEVRLTPVNVDLGSLLSLRVGDILRVGHALDEPVRIVAPNSPVQAEALCLGWLGQRDERLAIELVRTPAHDAR